MTEMCKSKPAVRFKAFHEKKGGMFDGEDRKTVAGVRLTLPDGRDASAFLVIRKIGGGDEYEALVTHDATDYAKGPSSGFRFKEGKVTLRFFLPKSLRERKSKRERQFLNNAYISGDMGPHNEGNSSD